MGWKTFKQHFNIDSRHTLELRKDGVAIGSGYIPAQVVISPVDGRIRKKEGFTDFLSKTYPAILEAPPELLVSLLAAPDVFERAIPVYAYKDGQIVEEFCEELGWPNCTHAGELMYDNTHLPNKRDAVLRAKELTALRIETMTSCVERAQRELDELKANVAEQEANALRLDQEYPDVVLQKS